MRVSDFHFDLPEDLIAQHPPATRGDSRMLVLDRATGAFTDDHFTIFPATSGPATSSSSTTPASSPRASSPSAPASNAQIPAPPSHRPHRSPPHEATGRCPANLDRPRPPRPQGPIGESLLFPTSRRSHPRSSTAEVIAAATSANVPFASPPRQTSSPSSSASATCPSHPISIARQMRLTPPEDRDRYQTVYAAALQVPPPPPPPASISPPRSSTPSAPAASRSITSPSTSASAPFSPSASTPREDPPPRRALHPPRSATADAINRAIRPTAASSP